MDKLDVVETNTFQVTRVFHVSVQYPRSVAGSSPEPGIMSHGDAVYGTDFRYQNRTRMTLT